MFWPFRSKKKGSVMDTEPKKDEKREASSPAIPRPASVADPLNDTRVLMANLTESQEELNKLKFQCRQKSETARLKASRLRHRMA